jgi:hypothetical protein
MDQQQNGSNWFRHLFSLDELKVSGLLIAMFAILIIDGFMAITRGDVPPQLSTITITIVAGVAGFNAISVVAGNISANKTGQPMQMPMQNNMYGSNMYGSYGVNNMYSSSYPMTQMNTLGTMGTSMNGNIATSSTIPVSSQVMPTTQSVTRPQDRGI